ncbi:MAG TPA: prepilin-type N-terminal cleavage/methylation domain-containing protein [Gemmatimonadaceae bacterium]|nr:prepilin-type N-terminal cleavage/methylation domain-containing protein [Gemmatimonadaceae bacterium]
MTNQQPDAPPAARRGFTIVEVMVAIVILSIGILALAATAGVVVRQMTGAVHQSVASTIAYSRMERIRSGNCVAMKDSSGPAAGVKTRNVTEFWRIKGTPGSHMLLVTDSIVFIVRGKQKFQKYITEYPCDPI